MILDVKGLEFSYNSHPTLQDVTFSVDEHDMVAIMGPNGVGKTTLLKCLNRILIPRGGMVTLDGDEIQEMKRKQVARCIGYVPQRGDVSRVTVYDSVLLGRRPHIDWDLNENDHKVIGRIIKLIGLEDMAMRYIDEISGGEFQMVQLARALAQQPRLVSLDEPTSNLDICNQHRMMKAIQNIVANNNLAAIMVIHDLNLSIRYSNKFILMKDGMIFKAGGREVLTPENIREVYNIDCCIEEYSGIPMVIPF